MTAMAHWLALLSLEPGLSPAPTAEDFGDGLAEAALVASAATKTPLPDVAVIAIGGADALDFVHAQFSGDCRALEPGDSLLTAWCTPKGRVLHLPRLVRTAEALYALLPQIQAAEFCKRLRMFVLRARVDIEDLSATHGVVVRNRPSTGADPASVAIPGIASARGALDRQSWYIGEFAALAVQWRALAAQPVGTAAAALADIRLGLPRLAPGLGDEYLPQELNLDLLGGVSFNKGCYPGQEIVARVKFRGTVKRRLQRFTASGTLPPAPGTRLLADGEGDAGTVLYAARASADTLELLAVTRLTAGAVSLPPDVMLQAAPLPGDPAG